MTSRWQPKALDEFGNTVRDPVARCDGVNTCSLSKVVGAAHVRQLMCRVAHPSWCAI